MQKKLLIPVLTGIILSLASPALATSETLPKGIWSFNVWHLDHEMDKVAVEDANGNVKFVRAREYVASSIPALDPLIQMNAIAPNTQLADTLKINSTFFQIAYGITPKLTIYAESVVHNTILTYSDGYIEAMKALDPDGSKNQIDVPPKHAYGRGLGDSALGIKYRFSNNTAMALSATAGFLKTGTDAKAKPKTRDNYERLETGERYDRYTLAFFHNIPLSKKYRLEMTGGYTYHAAGGWEEFLGNSFEFDAGDEVFFVLNNHFFPAKKHELSFTYTYNATGNDKIKPNGGPAVSVKNSSSQAHLVTIGYRYKPLIFLHLWTDYTITTAMEPALGIYEYPGRLYPSGMLRVGANLFFK